MVPRPPASSPPISLIPVAPGCGTCWRVPGEGFGVSEGLRTGRDGEVADTDSVREGSAQLAEPLPPQTQNQNPPSSPPGPYLLPTRQIPDFRLPCPPRLCGAGREVSFAAGRGQQSARRFLSFRDLSDVFFSSSYPLRGYLSLGHLEGGVCFFLDAGEEQERVGRENGELGFPRLSVGSENIRTVASEVRFSWKQSLRQDPRVRFVKEMLPGESQRERMKRGEEHQACAVR